MTKQKYVYYINVEKYQIFIPKWLKSEDLGGGGILVIVGQQKIFVTVPPTILDPATPLSHTLHYSVPCVCVLVM